MARDAQDPTDRRAFIGTVAAGTLGLVAPAATGAAQEGVAQSDPWLAALKGKHRQVFDTGTLNSGLPLIATLNYLTTMTSHYQLAAGDVGAMLVVRGQGVGLVLSDAIWARYRLGALWNVTDPATQAPAVRNRFVASRAGDMLNVNAAADRLLARGVVIGACSLAVRAMSGLAAAGAGVSPETALAEWTAGLLPGVHLLPSGVLAVGRAQEAGCTYCYAG